MTIQNFVYLLTHLRQFNNFESLMPVVFCSSSHVTGLELYLTVCRVRWAASSNGSGTAQRRAMLIGRHKS